MSDDVRPGDAVAAMVSAALPHVLQCYLDLISASPQDDLKAVQMHQAACKAALQHLDALLKLPVVAPDGENPASALADLLARAEAEVDRLDTTETSA